MVAGGSVGTGRAQDLARRAPARLAAWIAALGRAPRPPGAVWPLPATRHRLGIALVLGAVAVVASMYLADAAMIARTRQLPLAVIEAFNWVTDFGKSGWFLWPTGVAVIALALVASPALGRTSQLVVAALAVRFGFVFVAVGLPGLVVTVAKRIIGRARPAEIGPFGYEPFAWRPEFASLPSGHSTSAFGAAVAIALVWPKARLPMALFALTIGWSRIAIAAHYPSDVLAGAVVGAFGAILVRDWFALRRLGFAVGPGGAVTTLPGPSLRRIKMVARRVIGP